MNFVLVLLAFLITWCLLVAVGVGAFWWKLDRANRVAARHPTVAPMMWLWWPTRAAHLHRRLRNAVSINDRTRPRREVPADPSTVPGLHDQITEQALGIDRRLVIASRYPRRHRRPELDQLDIQVRKLEALSVRISRLGSADAQPGGLGSVHAPEPEVALDRIDQTISNHEQAREELKAIERSSGLVDDAFMTQLGLNQPQPAPRPRPDDRAQPERRQS